MLRNYKNHYLKMNNYKIKYSKEFKKSLKKVIKQSKNIDSLLMVVDLLSKRSRLDSKYKDHALINDKRFRNCRDCHIGGGCCCHNMEEAQGKGR